MKIHLNDMVFYGYHGVHPEERKLGQRFIVNMCIETNPDHDKNIKHLEDTVDYTKVYEIIRHIMEEREFFLLEVCANTLLESILDSFPEIINVNIKIQKPSVPISGSLSSVEVEMERNKV